MNDPRIDAAFLDLIDSKKGYFGLTYHYIIRTNGQIEIGRDPKTISSVGKRHLQPSQIVIGIVGGLSLDAKQEANETPEQEAALEWLMQALADTLMVPLEVTDGREYLQSGKHLIEDEDDQTTDQNHEDDEDDDQTTT